MTFDFKEIAFNLSAVDWRSVSLLEGAHLDADRVYLEEMMRCALFFSGRSGVVDLGESDLIPGQSSSQYVNVRLKRCFAITPQGYLICWDGDRQPGDGVTGSVDGSRVGETAPIYLCIDADRDSAYATPPQEIRNECSFIRRHFRLASETGEGELDALKIGQFKRSPDTNRLELDTAFIPECLRLDSHWLLKKRVGEIQQQARICLLNLQTQMKDNKFHMESMAASLGAASALVDWAVSPYVYLERMLAVMRTHFVLQYRIPDPGVKANVYGALDRALKYIEPNLQANVLDWAVTLNLIEETFKRLAGAFTGQTDGPKIRIPDLPNR